MSISRYFLVIIVLTLVLSLTGCSGIHPYENSLDKNLRVKTKTESGSFFTSIEARVDIYAVDSNCTLSYQGTVDLEEEETLIGLPENNNIFLDFIFSSSGFLSNTSGSTGFDTFVKTGTGYEYVADVSYDEGIYDVILHERKKGSDKLRELPYAECVPR